MAACQPLPSAISMRITQAGHQASYHVAFAMPAGPFSYQGVQLRVQWSVDASADLRRARNLRATGPTKVVPSPSFPMRVCRPNPPTLLFAATTSVWRALGYAVHTLGVMWGWLLHGFIAIMAHFHSMVAGELLIAVVLFVLGRGRALIALSRQELAERRLGSVTVSLNGQIGAIDASRAFRPEDLLRCSIHFRPRTSHRITSVAAGLEASERAMFTSNRGRETVTVPIYQ